MLKIYKVLLPVVVCIAYGNTSDNMAPVDWHNTHMLESCCNNSQLHNTVSKQVMSKNNNLLNQYNNDNQYTEQIWNNNVNTLINPIPVKKKLLNNNLTNNHQNLGIINNNESCMMLIYNCIKKCNTFDDFTKFISNSNINVTIGENENNLFNERIYINDKYIENNVIHNNNTFLNKKRLNDKNNEKDQVIDSKKLINDDLDNPNEDLAEDKIINNEQKNKNIIGNNNLLNIKINKLNNDKQIIHKNIKLQTVIDLDENGKSNAGKNNDNTLFDKKIHDKIIRLSFFDSYEKYGNKGNAIHHDIKQIFLNHPVFFSDYPGVNINNYMKNKKAKQRMDDLYNCYKTTIKKVLLSNGIKWSSTKHFKKG